MIRRLLFHARRARVPAFVLALLALAWLVTSARVVHRAAEGRIFRSLREVPRRQVAIVLGARVYGDGRLSATLADRVRCAVDLLRADKVERILVSGDHGRQRYDEVNAMADALRRAGVDDSVVFLDHAGFRTLDTMHRAREVFAVREAVVCTQGFHLPRSIYLAGRFGIDAVGLVAERQRYEGELRNSLRERLAVGAAVLDVALGRSARLLGPRHPIDGDGRSTRDRQRQLDPQPAR